MQVTPQVAPQVGSEVVVQSGLESGLESRLESLLAARVFSELSKNDLGKAKLSRLLLGHKTVSGELHKQIKRLLEAELIEVTIPDKPNSRLQKYRLTDKGSALQDASMRSAIPVCQKSVVAGCDYFSLGC
jgi:ATP-dependent DNA helicase RecG